MSLTAENLKSVERSTRLSVFLCYSRSDIEFVSALDAQLKASGIDVALDLRFQITPDYRRELFETILSTDTIIFVISPESVKSQHCGEELKYAIDHNKRLLAIMHKDGFDSSLLAPALKNPEWVFMRSISDLNERLPSLLSAIRTDFDLMQLHTRLLVRADEWEKSGFDRHFLLRGTLLESAQDWLPQASANVEQLPNPTELQTNYILASQRGRSAFVRRAAIGAVLIAAVVIFIGIIALIQAKQKDWANLAKEEAIRGRELALQNEQNAIQGREEEVKKREKAQEQERIALAEKTAALERERTALLAKAQAEIEKKKADYKAEVEQQRAEHEKLVRKANRTVLVGERLVESDPTRAVAFGVASKSFSPEWSAQTMVRRAALNLPAFQDLRVEDRKVRNGPELLPSNFVGLHAMHFAHNGNILLVHHLDGTVTLWNLQTGERSGRISRSKSKIVRVTIKNTFPTSVFVLFDDGTLERHRLLYNGTPNIQDTFSRNYIDLLSTPGGQEIVLLQRNGEIERLTGNNTPSTGLPPLKTGFESCALAGTGKYLACISAAGEVTKYDLSTGVETTLAQKVVSNTADVRDQELPRQLTIQIVDTANALVVGDVSKYSTHVEIFDVTTGVSIWRRSADSQYVRFAIDPGGGKLAVLSGGSIEQFQLNRDQQLIVTEYGKWNINPIQQDVGEAQAISYGPHGKYLLTASAPILTSVGPPPGTVKLWYSNPIDDSRAGDPYRGKLIGQQSKAVLNVAFDDLGRRIATFSTDGHVRIWDIFPEQSISTAAKARDYFAGFYHTPMATRYFLAAEFKSPEESISTIATLFKVRLDSNELKKLNDALDAQESTDSILNKLVDYVPSSIALQSRNRIKEVSDFYFRVPEGFNSQTNEYDPLAGNPPLQELTEDIVNRGLRDSSEILTRYLQAIEKDFLLLSGIQSTSLRQRLESRDSRVRATAWVILALSGDLNNLEVLRSQASNESAPDARQVAAWAAEFLRETGRDLRLSGETASKPKKQWQLLAVPKQVLDDFRFQQLLTIPADEKLARILFDRMRNTQAPPVSLLVAANRLSPTKGIDRDLNFVIMLRDLKAYDTALTWCSPLLGKADSNSRDSGQAENTYGHILYLKGQLEEAIPYYQKAIAAGRADGWPERNWADVLRALGREKEAKEKYQLALQRVLSLVEDARRRMRPDKFDELYEDLKPEIAGFYNALAWHVVTSTEVTTADLKSALESSMRASELANYKDHYILDTLAHAHAALKEYGKAVEIERRAIRLLSPSETQTRAHYEERVQVWSKQMNP
jgi:WD40 repeat protein